jgi:hypothetical protein
MGSIPGLGTKILRAPRHSKEKKKKFFSKLSRHITLSTKVRLEKAMVFPVVMYGCEIWNIKKAEGQRIVAFEL